MHLAREQQWKVTVFSICFSLCWLLNSHFPPATALPAFFVSWVCAFLFKLLALQSFPGPLSLCLFYLKSYLSNGSFLGQKTVTSVLADSESALALSLIRICVWVRKVSGMKRGQKIWPNSNFPSNLLGGLGLDIALWHSAFLAWLKLRNVVYNKEKRAEHNGMGL